MENLMTIPQPPQPGRKTLTVQTNRRDEVSADFLGKTWQVMIATTSKKPVPAPAPTNLLLASLGSCMIAGIEREAGARNLAIADVQVVTTAVRVPPPQPHLEEMAVHVTVFTPEPEAQFVPILEALNVNGTVTNTLKSGAPIAITYEIRTAEKQEQLAS